MAGAADPHAASLAALIGRIPAPDAGAAAAARRRLDRLTKPPGSLGELEALLVRLAAITGTVRPTFDHPAILIAAADHGVVAEGVSSYPQAVTGQMVLNFLGGGAAINALAASAGARVIVVDAGVAAELPNHPGLRREGLRRGTGNLLREPAMARAEAIALLLAGARVVAGECSAPPASAAPAVQSVHPVPAVQSVPSVQNPCPNLLALGEMGIGNSTAAACLTCVFAGIAPEEATGRGTGLDDAGLAHKRRVVAAALDRARPDPADPIGALAEVGGFEIALLAGAALEAAARRIPVVLDGYIATAAALVAAALAPAVRDYLIAGHRSAEPGHRAALARLELAPLLELEMRLGEGSGAALAIPLIQGAARIMRDMATFESAGVDDRAAPRDGSHIA